MLGQGSTLINVNKIIAFASKRPSDAESQYANIERELIVWYLVSKDSIHIVLYLSALGILLWLLPPVV